MGRGDELVQGLGVEGDTTWLAPGNGFEIDIVKLLPETSHNGRGGGHEFGLSI